MNVKDNWDKLKINIIFGRDSLLRLRAWGGDSTWRKILVYFLFSAVAISMPSYYVNSLLEKSESLMLENANKRSSLVEKQKFESAIEIVNLCINARDKSQDLEQWYCEFANKKYTSVIEHSTIDDEARDHIYKNSAYELMVLDLNGQLHHHEFKELGKSLPEDKFGKQLQKALSNISLFLFISVYSLFMIGLVSLFNFNRKNHNKRL